MPAATAEGVAAMVLELASSGPQPMNGPQAMPPDAPAKPTGWPIARLLPVVLVGLIFLAMVPVIGIAYFAAQSNFDSSSRQLNELTVDMIEQRLRAHLEPVRDQLAYISDAVAKGEIDFDDLAQWSSFALGTLAAAPQAVGFVVRSPSTASRCASRARRPQHAAGAAREPAVHQCDVRPGPHPERSAMGRAAMVAHRGRADPADHRADPCARAVPRRIGAAIGTSDLSRFVKSLELAGERKPFILAGRDKVLAHPWFGQGARHRRAARPRPVVETRRGQRSGAGRDVGARTERDLLAQRRRQHRLGSLELGRRPQPWLDLPPDRRLSTGLADHRLSPGRPRIRRGRAGSCAAS